jgi:hypothetical protein
MLMRVEVRFDVCRDKIGNVSHYGTRD